MQVYVLAFLALGIVPMAGQIFRESKVRCSQSRLMELKVDRKLNLSPNQPDSMNLKYNSDGFEKDGL